jgi:hypothetical protein
MKRTTCSACSGADLDVFLDLGDSPIADAYTVNRDDVSPTYPLQVAVCSKCLLVQLLEVVDAETLFGTGYSFYSSASKPLSEYHRNYAADVIDDYSSLAARGVVEIGCNDGDMLRHFQGFPHIGVDPAVGPTDVARERGLSVLTKSFGLNVAHNIRDQRGKQGLIIANHVLAHVADVADVLAGINALLMDDGVAFIEVQYLPDLLVNNAFDLVYHEHRNFFSLTSLQQAAIRHNLHITSAQLTNRQGGSLRVTLAKRAHASSAVNRLLKSEHWLTSFSAYDSMQGRAERIRKRLTDILDELSTSIAGYGAPAKATTLLNFCGITHSDLNYVVDTTTAKQGRFIPGTGIQILSPEDGGVADTQLLLAWNYTREVIHSHRKLNVNWIIPIPAPVMI